MKLTKEFIIKDIMNYEINEGINIFEELESCNIETCLDLLMIGNKCGFEEAESIFNRAINEMGLEEFVTKLAYELIGKEPEENEECNNSKKYSSYSEILEEYYNELQSVDENLGLSDFLNISTRYMYRYADGIQSRFINNKNIKLQDSYELTAMIIRGLSGDLNECPKYEKDGTIHKESNKDRVLRKLQGRRD